MPKGTAFVSLPTRGRKALKRREGDRREFKLDIDDKNGLTIAIQYSYNGTPQQKQLVRRQGSRGPRNRWWTGIGLMITQTLVENGAKVYIASTRLELDVTDKDSIRKAVKTIEEKEGKLDILVNKQVNTSLHIRSSSYSSSAGITGPSSPFFNDPSVPENKSPAAVGTALFENEKCADWQGLYGNNVASMFFVTYAFLGLLVKASEHEAKWAYNSSKAGIIHLTKMFATEFGLRKIPVRVNSIAPGTFPSEMTGHQDEHTLGKEDVDKASQGVQPIPFERSGNDIDMGGLALFLSSPAAYYVHGQIISIDGGFDAVNPT
ncbi:Enoyl-(Acyl carrier protein) reductase [Rhizoctonia solani]|uniref:Enoyl-(Acyl carrier protein) reductase n=1 Tax=Rhizoctonia solani TaxID=456999 RepID=A0A8H8NRS2_9AGAM|nr:Enoyl-(Acyl carrier protein) reductase [Rhizoctonia solani]QRW17602.1 Enoyl-(Acyl carrier protein) reductase [Rhizoctonia solani]